MQLVTYLWNDSYAFAAILPSLMSLVTCDVDETLTLASETGRYRPVTFVGSLWRGVPGIAGEADEYRKHDGWDDNHGGSCGSCYEYGYCSYEAATKRAENFGIAETKAVGYAATYEGKLDMGELTPLR